MYYNTYILYNNSNLTVNHYSSVTYYITVTDSSYIVEGQAIENSVTVSKIKECIYSGSTITLNEKTNNNVINTMIYKYPDLVTNGYRLFGQVEIENKDGVLQRIQFLYDKPLFSYEIDQTYEDVQFHNGYCISDVNIYQTFNKGINNSFNGKVRYNDGIKMEKDPSVNNSYSLDIASMSGTSLNGNYMITGWVKSNSVYNNAFFKQLIWFILGYLIIFILNKFNNTFTIPDIIRIAPATERSKPIFFSLFIRNTLFSVAEAYSEAVEKA